jgi:hypothetical protein
MGFPPPANSKLRARGKDPLNRRPVARCHPNCQCDGMTWQVASPPPGGYRPRAIGGTEGRNHHGED